MFPRQGAAPDEVAGGIGLSPELPTRLQPGHGTVYSWCLASVLNIQEHKAAGEQGGCAGTLGSCWWDRAQCGTGAQHCRQHLPPVGGSVGVIGHPAAPAAPVGQGDPPSLTLCMGETPFPIPSLCWQATLPPAAVDSQAPTSSPGAEPEMLLQARLKRTKCSTCKICSVRK